MQYYAYNTFITGNLVWSAQHVYLPDAAMAHDRLVLMLCSDTMSIVDIIWLWKNYGLKRIGAGSSYYLRVLSWLLPIGAEENYRTLQSEYLVPRLRFEQVTIQIQVQIRCISTESAFWFLCLILQCYNL